MVSRAVLSAKIVRGLSATYSW